MKRLLAAAAALGLLAAGAPASADHRHEGKAAAKPHKHAKAQRKAVHRAQQAWRKGQRLPAAHRDHLIGDPSAYGLRQAPAGYRWVLMEDDAYLVRRDDGLIADLVLNILRGR